MIHSQYTCRSVISPTKEVTLTVDLKGVSLGEESPELICVTIYDMARQIVELLEKEMKRRTEVDHE